jgi:hypothetical protein
LFSSAVSYDKAIEATRLKMSLQLVAPSPPHFS